MTLEQALNDNPYDPNKGNIAAYIRYLRYNVDGFYEKSSLWVKKILIHHNALRREEMIIAQYQKPYVPKYANYDYMKVYNRSGAFVGWIRIEFVLEFRKERKINA